MMGKVLTKEEIEAKVKVFFKENPDDYSKLREFIEENKDNYKELKEFAFSTALQIDARRYVEEYYEEIELNNDDGYSPYLYDACNDELKELLMNHGAYQCYDDYSDCRFAIETNNWEILAFDSNFQKEVFEKYLSEFNITKEDIISFFEDEDFAEKYYGEHDDFDRSIDEDMENLGISVEDGKIEFLDYNQAELGSGTMDLIEELGWSCEFEGTKWYFETLGVYFIR